MNVSATIDQQETETALKLVQYQNKALRDRLRSTAAENERLHEMIKEYRVGRVEGGSPSDMETSSGGGREIQLLRDRIASLEDAAKKKESMHKEEMERLKSEHQVRVREMEDSEQETVNRLNEALQRVQDELRIVVKERDDLQSHVGEKVGKCDVDDTMGTEMTDAIARLELQMKEKDDLIAHHGTRCTMLEAELQEAANTSEKESVILQEQIEAKNKEIDRIQEKLREAEEMLEERNAQKDEAHTCEQCSSMENLINEKERLSLEMSNAIKRAMKIEAERDDLKVELESVRREYTNRILMLEQSLSTHTSATEALEADLKSQIAENDSLQKRLDELHHSLQEKTDDGGEYLLEQANRKVVELEDALSKERQQFETYSKTTEEKLENLESIISSGAKAIEEVHRLKKLLADAEKKISKMDQHANMTENPIEMSGNTPDDDAPSYAAVMGDTVIDLRNTITQLESSLQESEKTHALRDKATEILKREVEDLKRANKRSDVDLEYLKAVLVKSFACGELDSKSHIFDVISRLLLFSPEEIEEAKKPRQDEASLFEKLPSFDAIKSFLPSAAI